MQQNDDARTFLLCLGHQKCGTTWFHRYLCQNDNFDTGIAKEYHIWDGLDVPQMRHKRRPFKDRWGEEKDKKRYFMQRRPDLYFDFFTSLFRPGINITADITPSYSGLKPKRLHFIREGFRKRGVDVKVVVFIRDPVSRIKSAVRKNLDKRNYKEGIRKGTMDFTDAVRQYYPSEHCRFRTSYDKTILQAFDVFGRDKVYVGVFEDMFEPANVKKVSEFCGVETRQEFAAVAINRTRTKVYSNEALEHEIVNAYQSVYDFCFKNFPSTQQLWLRQSTC